MVTRGREKNSMPLSLDDCYKILELSPSCSDEELEKARRTLVKVWHPDRFQNDEQLRHLAEEKLKEINEAFDTIKKARAQGFRQEPPKAHSPASGAPDSTVSSPSATSSRTHAPRASRTGNHEEGVPRASATARARDEGFRTSHESKPSEDPRATRNREKIFAEPKPVAERQGMWDLERIVGLVGMVLAISLSRYCREEFSKQRHTSRPAPDLVSTYQAPAPSPATTFQPSRDLYAEIIVRSNVTDDAVFINDEFFGRTPVRLRVQPGRYKISVQKEGYYTSGEVVDVKAFETRTIWATLKPYPENNPPAGTTGPPVARTAGAMPARDLRSPSTRPVSPSVQGQITLGTSEQGVLAAMGEPDECTTDAFRYGRSYVYFSHGRVSGWVNSKDRRLPISMASFVGGPPTRPCIAPGSPISDLVGLAGAPDAVIEDRWYFGTCYVKIKGSSVMEIHGSNVRGCQFPRCE